MRHDHATLTDFFLKSIDLHRIDPFFSITKEKKGDLTTLKLEKDGSFFLVSTIDYDDSLSIDANLLMIPKTFYMLCINENFNPEFFLFIYNKSIESY